LTPGGVIERPLGGNVNCRLHEGVSAGAALSSTCETFGEDARALCFGTELQACHTPPLGHIVVGPGWMVDRITAAHGGPALEGQELARQPWVVQKLHRATGEQGQDVAIDLGPRSICRLVDDMVPLEGRRRPIATVSIADQDPHAYRSSTSATSSTTRSGLNGGRASRSTSSMTLSAPRSWWLIAKVMESPRIRRQGRRRRRSGRPQEGPRSPRGRIATRAGCRRGRPIR
jgi:hypothetical protein